MSDRDDRPAGVRHGELPDDSPAKTPKSTGQGPPRVAVLAARGGVVAGLAVILVAALFVTLHGGGSAPVGTPTAVPTPVVPTVTGSVGEAVQVGGLALKVVKVDAQFDSKQYGADNTANYAVQVAVSNMGKDGAATFVPSVFRLVDNTGAASGIAACMGCPARFTVDQKLAPGAGTSGWVYFLLPAGRTADYLRYHVPTQNLAAIVHLP